MILIYVKFRKEKLMMMKEQEAYIFVHIHNTTTKIQVVMKWYELDFLIVKIQL